MHLPVMAGEVIEYLNIKKGDIVLDATVGGGGHAKEILKKIAPGGRLIGLDADRGTLLKAAEALNGYEGSYTLIHENFRNAASVLAAEGIEKVDAALLDIGVSSFQLDEAERGFSIKLDARLDMRMDDRLTVSAYEIVNRAREEELSDIILRFGEDYFHRRIAAAIVRERRKAPLVTTSELARVVRAAIGGRGGWKKIDPATRTFQALRIAVNKELEALEEGVEGIVPALSTGGRLGVISFHSLEDRIVKNLFKRYKSNGTMKIITKKPMVPSRHEAMMNPRSRSAKFRVAERV